MVEEELKLQKTRFDTKGIISALKKLGYSNKTFYRAISEYIWNGFDAGATLIELDYDLYQDKKDGYFRKLTIKDNGKGIRKNDINMSFEPIFDSHKLLDKSLNNHISTTHGKNGVGRLTFHTFCNRVIYDTTFEDIDCKKNFSIKLDALQLDKFNISDAQQTVDETGTKVTFEGFENINKKDIEKDLTEFLLKEFCWYLELNKKKDFKLMINGSEMDYSNLISERDSLNIEYKEKKFNVSYVKWNCLLNKEYSKFYFLDSDYKEVWKENTKLNSQGDDFYHSLFIQSDYFDVFDFNSNEESTQKTLEGGSKSEDVYKKLIEETYIFLRIKRKPFLRENSKKVLEEFRNDGAFKNVEENSLEEIEQQDLEDVFKGIYEVQPKFFTKLSKEQKKIFIGFMDSVLKSDSRMELLNIVDEVVKLSDDEKKELSDILKVTKLNKVIRTTTLLNNRFKIIEYMKELVYGNDYGTNERDHIQKIIEDNYWIFGEQYHLVTADEPFQKSLEKYLYILDGVDKSITIDSKYKKKRMDIFMSKRCHTGGRIENVIVELKSPTVKLSQKEYMQVEMYRQAIINEPRFKSKSSTWKMFLISSDFSSDGYIEEQIKNSKGHGEKNLIFSNDTFKIYAKRWSDVFDEFDLSHEFFIKELELEKELLLGNFDSADEGLEQIKKLNKI